MKNVKCPDCKGRGQITIVVSEHGKPGATKTDIDCITCHGKKAVTPDQAKRYKELKDMWCRCKADHGSYHTWAGTDIYICNHCGKVTQTG